MVLGADNKVARRLGLTNSRKQQVLLGDASGRLAGGRKNVTVKLSPRARHALRRSRLKMLSLILDVAAKGADGRRVNHSYTVTVGR